MEITGKLLQVLPAQSGKSARGEWKRQDFIIETTDEYPKKVCISNWNNKVDIDALQPGTELKVSINIESREYNGRWYTDVKAWKMDTHSGADTTPPPSDAPPVPGANDIPWDDNSDESDDLPF